PTGAVQVHMLLADRAWLRVQPASTTLKELAVDPIAPALRSGLVPFRVELQSGAELSPQPSPRGFLAEARAAGRSFHRAVPVPLRPAVGGLQVLPTHTPPLPAPPLDSVRLRPAKVLQEFHLYLYNPARQAQEVIVQLLDKGMPLKGGEVKALVL